MKDFFKSAISDLCKGATPLQVIKRILGFILMIVILITTAGADSIGGFKVIVIIGIVALIWYFLGINDAWDNNKDKE